MIARESTRMIKKIKTKINPKALAIITKPPCLSGVIIASGSEIVLLDDIVRIADHPTSTLPQQIQDPSEKTRRLGP